MTRHNRKTVLAAARAMERTTPHIPSEPHQVSSPSARAPKGQVEARMLLKYPLELEEQVRAAAEREGVSQAEWWRRAARDRVLRQAWEYMKQRR